MRFPQVPIGGLRRHWGILVAFAIALGGAPALYVMLSPAQLDLPRYEYADWPESGVALARSRCEPATLAAIRNPAEAASARERCAEEAESRALQNYALIQQMRAADAAQAQARIDHEIAWMGVYGTIGGFLTLLAAAAAAFYARRAAHAANDSLDHAKITSQSDLRPWVDMDMRPGRAALHANELVVSCIIDLKNIGRTPAQNIRLCHRATAMRSTDEAVVEEFLEGAFEGSDDARSAAILPGREHGEEQVISIAWRMEEADLALGIVVLVGISVLYDLPDGATGQTSYSFWIGFANEEDAGDLRPIPRPEPAVAELSGLRARRAGQSKVV